MNETPLRTRDVNAPVSAAKTKAWMNEYTYTPNRAPATLPTTPHDERIRRHEHGIAACMTSLLAPPERTPP